MNMHKILGLSLAFLFSAACIHGAGAIKVEAMRENKGVDAWIEKGIGANDVPFKGDTWYAQLDNVVQSDTQIVTHEFKLNLARANSDSNPKIITIGILVAPAKWGWYNMNGVSMPQDSVVGFLNKRKRVNLWGNSGQGAKAQTSIQTVVDGTPVTIILETVFESGERKVKIYIK